MASHHRYENVSPFPSQRRSARRDTEGARLVSSGLLGVGLVAAAVVVAVALGGHQTVGVKGYWGSELSQHAMQVLEEQGNASEGGKHKGDVIESIGHVKDNIEREFGMVERPPEECIPSMRLANGKCPPKEHMFMGMGNIISTWMLVLVLIPLTGMLVYFGSEVWGGLEGRMQAYKLPDGDDQ